MSNKSGSSHKKKEVPLWFTCDKCKLIVMNKPSSENHLNCDDKTNSYVVSVSNGMALLFIICKEFFLTFL